MAASSSLTLNWWIRFHQTTLQRLPGPAERLVFFAIAAEQDENLQRQSGGPRRHDDTAMHVSQRARSENRKHAHFKCDNRTAV